MKELYKSDNFKVEYNEIDNEIIVVHLYKTCIDSAVFVNRDSLEVTELELVEVE